MQKQFCCATLVWKVPSAIEKNKSIMNSLNSQPPMQKQSNFYYFRSHLVEIV